MDYEAMSGGELQEECARRGLPSSRAAKAVMVKRLTDHDAQQTADSAPAITLEAADDAVLAPLSGPESMIPAHAIKDMQMGLAAGEPVRVFRQTFDAEPGGPDEETHLTYRQATVVAALAAGMQPRGDAHLAATIDGRWVYEVSVRQVT